MYSAYLVKYDQNGNKSVTCFYDDGSVTNDTKVLSPVLTMEENKAGSFEFTAVPGNVCYDDFVLFKSFVVVTRHGKELWEGRVIDEQMDFFKRKKIVCEGELAYFNDVCHPYTVYKFQTGMQYLSGLLYAYNNMVPDYMKFELGMVTVNLDLFPEEVVANYETIMELLQELQEKYKGIFRVRKTNGVRYLDWLDDYPRVCTQAIEFGNNLLDYTHSFDVTDLCTVVIPLGEKIETIDEATQEAINPNERLTCAEANEGSPYVVSEEAVAKFGWIERVLDLDDVTSAGTLLSEGRRYLAEEQFDKMTIEVTALDLSYLNERSYWSEEK